MKTPRIGFKTPVALAGSVLAGLVLPGLILSGLLLTIIVPAAGLCTGVLAAETAEVDRKAAGNAAVPDQAAAEAAGALVDEVLRNTVGGEAVEAWTRSVIERAVGRAMERTGPMLGKTAPRHTGLMETTPLPAGRNAARMASRLPVRPNSGEVLVFMSLAVPPASWRQWSRDAARAGAPIVVRGIGQDGLQAFAGRIGERLGGSNAGAAIDPRLFRLFGIGRVPAVAVVPGGVPPCASRGCGDDPPSAPRPRNRKHRP